jgi:hypothetical protein
MLENIVDFVGCIFLSALTLLIGSCTLGSIVVALRAVGHGSITVNTRRRTSLVAEVSGSDDRMLKTGAMVTRIAGTD